MNDAMAKTLGAIDPRLGAIFNASSDATVNEMMRQISTSGQDAVERYFQASNNKLVRWPAASVNVAVAVCCLQGGTMGRLRSTAGCCQLSNRESFSCSSSTNTPERLTDR